MSNRKNETTNFGKVVDNLLGAISKPLPDKEVLHTQGEWKFKVLPESTHITVYSEMHGAICSIPANSNHFEEHKANAELICKAVNNYQTLLDSNKELLEALTELHNMVQHMKSPEKTDRFYNAIVQAQAAIKNNTK